MPDALFIGGGTGAGKTTVARALAGRHGLRLLHVDSFWYEHADRAGDVAPPPDVQWLEWTPSTQAADFERIARLMIGYVLEDVRTLPRQPAVVVEGPQVLPDALARDARAVFLIPTPEFQRAVLAQRPMPSSDPQRALAARLAKDRLYADRLAAAARARGFRVVEIDGSRPPDAIVADVEHEFRDVLLANEPHDLVAVRRWENEATARNLRAWIASGDLAGSESLPFPFACECGTVGCGERVELTLADYERAPAVLAH